MRSLLSLLFLSLLSAENFNDFIQDDTKALQQEKASFAKEKKELEQEFKNYQAIVNEEFNNYKKELGAFWSEPKLSTKTTWVAYSKDKRSRSIVDFENEEITIEVNANDFNSAQKEFAKELINAVSSTTQEAYENDELSTRIDKRLKTAVKAPVQPVPILAPIIFSTPPTIKEQVAYAKKSIQANTVQTLNSKIPHTKRFVMHIKMPKNTTIKRSKFYLDQAKAQAREFKMPLALVLAIMHSESDFNPMARSHIPAYGLMQIVPQSAGADTYEYLYKSKRILSSSYLYNADNNIKIGTAYLSILYFRYLKDISNMQSRLYATIAAYNTGAGNVARTFSGTTSTSKAAKRINQMRPSEVYSYMKKNLKYAETRHYLEKVSSRVAAYEKIYGQN